MLKTQLQQMPLEGFPPGFIFALVVTALLSTSHGADATEVEETNWRQSFDIDVS